MAPKTLKPAGTKGETMPPAQAAAKKSAKGPAKTMPAAPKKTPAKRAKKG